MLNYAHIYLPTIMLKLCQHNSLAIALHAYQTGGGCGVSTLTY